MTWFERLRKTRRKLVKKNGRRLLQALDRYLGSRSLVGDHPFFDPAQFPAVATLEAKMASVSGVSLDEEGANLVRYQNSYNAAAKVITTVQELYDTLMNMV